MVVYAGDGTVNAVLTALHAWNGAILILPGGTMNLLARALHGDQPCQSIIQQAACNRRTKKLNTVEIGDSIAYVGVIAGPTTSLAQVRENARHARLSELVLEAIPAAITETLGGPQIGVEGHDGRFPAIFAAPRENAMELCGFTASSIGEVLSHASAWLNGDFRDGPRVDLGAAPTATLVSEAEEIGLLIDGEPADARPGDVLRLAEAPHNFIETRAPAAP